jgi:hypothetical protein
MPMKPLSGPLACWPTRAWPAAHQARAADAEALDQASRSSGSRSTSRYHSRIQGLIDFAIVHSYLGTATKWASTTPRTTPALHRRMATTSLTPS